MAKNNIATSQPSVIKTHNLAIVENFVAEILISYGKISRSKSNNFSIMLPKKDEDGRVIYANEKEFFMLREKMATEIGDSAMNCIAIRKGKKRITTVEYRAKEISKRWKHRWPIST